MQLIKAARGGITTRHGEDIGRDGVTGAKGHVGIDIGHGNQTPDDLRIGAPAAGVVRAVGNSGSYGLRIIIDHDDGTWSLIAHLSEEFVEVGQRVEQNQRIGTMGHSGGDWPVHCHQEYHLANGAAVDPLAYMTSAAGGGSTSVGVQELDVQERAWLQQAATDASVIKQLLVETQQWKGISATLGEVWKNVGLILQVLTETKQWDGIDMKGQKTLAMLQKLIDRPNVALSEQDLAALASQIERDPIDWGELRQIIDEETNETQTALEAFIADDTVASEQRLLTAISNTDDEFLASLGLKRI